MSIAWRCVLIGLALSACEHANEPMPETPGEGKPSLGVHEVTRRVDIEKDELAVVDRTDVLGRHVADAIEGIDELVPFSADKYVHGLSEEKW